MSLTFNHRRHHLASAALTGLLAACGLTGAAHAAPTFAVSSALTRTINLGRTTQGKSFSNSGSYNI